MMLTRQQLGSSARWVVKIGSSLITNDGQGLNQSAISDWADQIAYLRNAGKVIVLVSSGAVAEGVSRLGLKKRPRALHALQAAAAIGQMGLVQAYESDFQKHGLHTAQVLLTHDDLQDRRRYINARSTLRTLLEWGIIPVVNENDTVATEEIRFGDNDSLAALVTNLVEAQLLVILTDQGGLYDRDPRTDDNAQLIEFAQATDHALDKAAGPSAGEFGRGGMITKVSAARRAARSGAATLIVPGRIPRLFELIAEGKSLGTLLLPKDPPLAARKQWIANQLKVRGTLTLDAGAIRVIREAGRSLLPVGVINVKGKFSRGDMVACVNLEGREVGRGLVNYDTAETLKIKGRPSHEIEAILGYVDEPELIHRDNLAII